ncbi:UV-endonuclease UvdE [Pleurostoma richardsiae]|uniref:UV-endonuclease UvdE n=1 Tax=Pleurostoma richardsiae TaxID=41990 RepID=A0AA38RHZ0_9PEZI|nr:UV-endonuclease UvdE [Pleurostoma richardsiae]
MQSDKGAAPGIGSQQDSSSASSASSPDDPQAMAPKAELYGNRSPGQVNEAIERLVKMERKFRRAVKRQKQQLETSVIESSKETPGGPATARVVGDKATEKTTLPANPTDRSILPTPDGDGDDVAGQYMTATQIPEEDMEDVDENVLESTENLEVAERGASRPPPVNSDYLPLPWKGRLGYACLNTYLRNAKPPVFCSRTCRIASIIEHRHPLQDPSQPESTKNRPDKTKPADKALGMKFVQQLGLTNAADLVKMLRWNDKYGIKFMRLSSEMFPFASHPEHGYKLAPFASEMLAEAGKVVAELGHRVTMHPGQFTQLGSPRKEVINASVRDLEYHDELLSLLRLPPQQDRDAVMIIHMGGTYGDKTATLDRFRANYNTLLSDSVKRRLVLENDDVAWSVHDLLPVCEELNIPLVLDYHHHNIVFDASQVREGTLDISRPELMDRIANTWTRKGIKQKMHYSEQVAGTTTPRDRRKHAARVRTLPPCPNDMDLMIEAKDKEQAVLELMRTFKLPGHELSNDLVPYERLDEDRAPPPKKKQADGGGKKSNKRKRKGAVAEEETDVKREEDEGGNGDGEKQPEETGGNEKISKEEFGMGGPLNRVYWPLGMEEWLRPKKKERKPKMKDEEGEEV